MKRFYQDVNIKSEDGVYRITLDGKPVRTPLGAELVTESENLASEVAGEWRAQHDKIDPHTMPQTRLLNTQIDQVAPRREEMISGVIGYAESDPVCYYAESPEDLRARQKNLWGILTDWLAQGFGVDMVVTFGINHAPQSEEALKKLRTVIAELSDRELTGLQAAVGATGSFVVALALIKGRLSPEETYETALLEELYQSENWGRDEAAEARRAGIKKELEDIYKFCTL